MRVEDGWAALTEAELQTVFFFLLSDSKSPWLYDIPDIHENSCGHTSASLAFIRCTWTCVLLTCHPRKFSWSHLQRAAYTMPVITLPSSMPPKQCIRHSLREHLRPVYFRYQVHFRLFLFPVSDFCSRIHRFQRGLQVNIQHYGPTFFRVMKKILLWKNLFHKIRKCYWSQKIVVFCIYIYIYECVCLCVCVCCRNTKSEPPKKILSGIVSGSKYHYH